MRTFPELEAAEASGSPALDGLLLPAEAALEGWPSAHLGAEDASRLAHGQAIAAEPGLPCGNVKVYGGSGRLIAIGVVTEQRQLTPSRVFLR